jgi:uncharacterized membrane protein
MNHQGHIGAFHSRVAGRWRQPSLRTHRSSTSSSRKSAIMQQGAFLYNVSVIFDTQSASAHVESPFLQLQLYKYFSSRLFNLWQNFTPYQSHDASLNIPIQIITTQCSARAH